VRFVLIHGAYHGAWCWDLLRPELERLGHEVIAPDLPCEDPRAGAAAYATTVIDAVPPSPASTVIVGHSLGGLTAPIVASRIATHRLVFLCALLPLPGSSFDGQGLDIESGFRPSASPIEQPDGSAKWPEQGAIEEYYHDCDPGVARWAAQRLRAQHWRITEEQTPLLRWPDVPSSYVLARDDRGVAPRYSRHVARERLLVEPIEIDGGHSPFLSRPAELAAILSALG
jgi:pimeloyl-ACP methyl ester carboxylesterase